MFRDPLTLAAGLILALVILGALFAPLVAPYSPTDQSPDASLEGPSWSHPFGTDHFGRDMLSRIIYGGRVSLLIGFGSVSLALLIGLCLGVVSGFYRGALDAVLMRGLDIALAFPLIIFATLVVIVLGPSMTTVIFAIGVALVPMFARLARSRVLSLREQEFFEASVAIGCSNRRLMWHHILPHVLPLMLVQATTALGLAILLGAGLSFIGIGVQPPTADWGRMIAEYSPLVFSDPALAVYPGLAIAVVALVLNLLGDGLLRAVDPTARLSLD